MWRWAGLGGMGGACGCGRGLGWLYDRVDNCGRGLRLWAGPIRLHGELGWRLWAGLGLWAGLIWLHCGWGCRLWEGLRSVGGVVVVGGAWAVGGAYLTTWWRFWAGIGLVGGA